MTTQDKRLEDLEAAIAPTEPRINTIEIRDYTGAVRERWEYDRLTGRWITTYQAPGETEFLDLKGLTNDTQC
jgi:hypothetical protein